MALTYAQSSLSPVFPRLRGSARLLLLKSLCRVHGLQTLPTLCRPEALLPSMLVATCLASPIPGCTEGGHLTALLSGPGRLPATCTGGHGVFVGSQGVLSDVAATWPHVTT